jgi:hypothetical protein
VEGYPLSLEISEIQNSEKKWHKKQKIYTGTPSKYVKKKTKKPNKLAPCGTFCSRNKIVKLIAIQT